MPLCFHEQRGIPFYSLPEKEGLLFLHRIINRFLYPFTNVQLIQFTVGRVRINPVTQKDIDQLIHRVHPSTGPGKPSMTIHFGRHTTFPSVREGNCSSFLLSDSE